MKTFTLVNEGTLGPDYTHLIVEQPGDGRVFLDLDIISGDAAGVRRGIVLRQKQIKRLASALMDVLQEDETDD